MKVTLRGVLASSNGRGLTPKVLTLAVISWGDMIVQYNEGTMCGARKGAFQVVIMVPLTTYIGCKITQYSESDHVGAFQKMCANWCLD